MFEPLYDHRFQVVCDSIALEELIQEFMGSSWIIIDFCYLICTEREWWNHARTRLEESY